MRYITNTIYILVISMAFVIQQGVAQESGAIHGEIRINSMKGHTLVPGSSGFNVRIADKVWSYTHPDFKEAIRQVKPGWLRFFSGTMGSAFSAATGLYNIDYAYMMGHQEQYFKGHRFTQIKGPHRIADLYHVLGEHRGKLVVTINGFTETPEMTAALAQFTRDNHIEVEVWQFCNEPYFYVPSRNRYWWNNGYDYAVKMKPHADEILKVFPNAKLALNFTWDGIWGFMKEIHHYQQENGAYWNVFSKHSYAPHIGGKESFGQAYRRVNTKVIEATSPKAMQDIENYTEAGIPMLITEFGVWNRPVNGIISAIYNAEYTLRQLQHPNTYLIGSHEISNKFTPRENKNELIIDAFNKGKPLNTDSIRTGITSTGEGKALQLLHEALNNTDFTYATTVSHSAEVPALNNTTEPSVYARAFKGIQGEDYLAITNRSGEYCYFDVLIDGKLLSKPHRTSYVWSSTANSKHVERIDENIAKQGKVSVYPYSVTLVRWKNDRELPPLTSRIYHGKVTADGVELKWWPVDDVTTYRIDYGKALGALDTSVSVKVPVTSYELKGLDRNTTYYFRVTASNPLGESDPSNVVKLHTSVPRSPEIFKVSKRDTTVTVFWKSVENATGYRVRLMSGDGVVDRVEEAKNVFGYRITGLSFDIPYQVSVRAYNGIGEGKSSVRHAFTCKKYIPIPARNVSARENANGDIVVQWQRQDTIDRQVYFKVLRGNEPHRFNVLATGLSGDTYIDKTAGQEKYFYTVKTYSNAGEVDFYPNIATVIRRDETAFVTVKKVDKGDDAFKVHMAVENVALNEKIKVGAAFSDVSYLNVEEDRVNGEITGKHSFTVKIPFEKLKNERIYALRGFIHIKDRVVYSLPPYAQLKF